MATTDLAYEETLCPPLKEASAEVKHKKTPFYWQENWSSGILMCKPEEKS